jgi:hypothetical protein
MDTQLLSEERPALTARAHQEEEKERRTEERDRRDRCDSGRQASSRVKLASLPVELVSRRRKQTVTTRTATMNKKGEKREKAFTRPRQAPPSLRSSRLPG